MKLRTYLYSIIFSFFIIPSFVFAATKELERTEEGRAIPLGGYVPNEVSKCTISGVTSLQNGRFVYDANKRQMLLFGGGKNATARTDVDVFSLTSLFWGSAYNSTVSSDMKNTNFSTTTGGWKTTGHPVARKVYDMMSFSVATNELILLAPVTSPSSCQDVFAYQNYPGVIWHYSPATKKWRATNTPLPAGWVAEQGSVEYDPVSSMVIMVSKSGLWTYNPRTEKITKQVIFTESAIGSFENLVYYPPNGNLYYFTNKGQVFEVVLNRSDFAKSKVTLISKVQGDTPSAFVVDFGETGWVYDSLHAVIGGGVRDGFFFAYNPETKTWTRKSIESAFPVGTLIAHAIDFDPVDGVFIFFTSSDGSVSSSVTPMLWAYRYGDVKKIEEIATTSTQVVATSTELVVASSSLGVTTGTTTIVVATTSSSTTSAISTENATSSLVVQTSSTTVKVISSSSTSVIVNEQKSKSVCPENIPKITRVLAKKSSGEQVKFLQCHLANLGFFPEAKVNGYFGPLTEESVKKFQCDKGIVCSTTRPLIGYGRVGPSTRAAINE